VGIRERDHFERAYAGRAAEGTEHDAECAVDWEDLRSQADCPALGEHFDRRPVDVDLQMNRPVD
jgi:hypothetical protein